MAKAFADAGRAYEKAADCHKKAKSSYDTASCLSKAGEACAAVTTGAHQAAVCSRSSVAEVSAAGSARGEPQGASAGSCPN